jgi:large subunit ribosomal protein L10
MSKAVKEMVIDDIGRRLGDETDMLVVDMSKLDAFAANKWRLDLRKKNIRVLTIRNTLARKALERSGVSGLDQILEGPSTLLFGGRDIVALSKEIVEATKGSNEKIKIKGGSVEGSVLDAGGVDSLSKSPSREELIAKIAGQILAPGANLAAALLGPGSMLASQLKSKSEDGDNGSGEAATESA